MPLGIMEDAAYESGTVTLQTGDWLVIFTDGVVEAENNSQQEYGETRLLTMLNAGVIADASDAAEHHLVDLDRFVGNAPQHDDVTCLLVKAT